MTKTIEITIYDLIPLLKKGWVAMDEDGTWWWHKSKPSVDCNIYSRNYDGIWSSCSSVRTLDVFNIAPFDGDWKDSLIKVGAK